MILTTKADDRIKLKTRKKKKVLGIRDRLITKTIDK